VIIGAEYPYEIEGVGLYDVLPKEEERLEDIDDDDLKELPPDLPPL